MRKRALITGASEGIGKEIAKVFAMHGYDLVIVARNNEKLDALKEELVSLNGIDVQIICIDLSDPTNPEKLYRAMSHLQIDVLINNAGMGSFGEFYKSDIEKEEKLIMLNVVSLVKLTHLYITDMARRNDGCIINIGSTASFQPGPLMANYYASKAYVLSFTEAVAEEMKNTNVKVIAYCPAPTRTGFLTKANISRDKALQGKNLKSPREVAEDIYQTMNRGKSFKISSKRMKAAIFLERLVPRSLTNRFVYNMQSKRKDDSTKKEDNKEE